MATQENTTNNSSITSSSNSTRIVAFFSNRDEAYKAMSDLKDAGFSTGQIGLAVGQESGRRSPTGTREMETGTQDTSFWQKVKDFFSGQDHGEDYDDQADFRNASADMGWDEQRHGYYQQGISSGGAVVTVTGDRIQEAREILEENGGDLREGGFEQNSFRQSGLEEGNVIPGAESGSGNLGVNANRSDLDGERRIQLRGEMLRTYKERVQRGEVTLRKEVVTENQSVNVPVSREELVIERAQGAGQAMGEIGNDEEVRVPLSEERVRVEKQPVVNEEIRVGKRQVQSNQQVSDQVRHEELRVDKQGELDTEIDQGKTKKRKPAA